MVDGDEQVLSTDNSRQVFSVEDTEIPPKTSKQEISNPSQISIGDMKPTTSSQSLQRRLSEVEKISNLPCMAARDRKSYPEKASSAGHFEDPIDEPNCPRIQRKHMPSDHYQKEPMTPRTEKPNIQLGPVSTSSRGNHGSLSNYMSFTLLVLFLFLFLVLIIRLVP